MRFPFDFYRTFDDVQVAHYEGRAIVERCVTDPDDWNITGIELDGLKQAIDGRWMPTTVTVPSDDPLAKLITLHLYSTKQRELDEAWTSYVAQQKADRVPV